MLMSCLGDWDVGGLDRGPLQRHSDVKRIFSAFGRSAHIFAACAPRARHDTIAFDEDEN